MKENYIRVCWLGNLESLQVQEVLANPKTGINDSSAICKNGMFNKERIIL